MKMWALTIVLAGAVTAGSSWAGPTTGENHSGVNKDCVARVFGYVADGAAPLKGQARFDHFKKRLVTDPESAVRPFINFVPIGGKQKASDDPSALPECSGDAYLR